MRRIHGSHVLVTGVALSALLAFTRCSESPPPPNPGTTPAPTTTANAGGKKLDDKSLFVDPAMLAATSMVTDGRQTFRYDTFGDEAFWGGTLKLHQAIATVSPKTALAVGLKVDVDALPPDLQNKIAHGQVNLDDPATTAALLRINAVVGVTGFFDANKQLSSIGIQCALCHSTVDDSFAPGVGHRLDGWPNRDLDVGTIIGLSPDLSAVDNVLGVDDATTRAVLKSWGPGKFDAELILDGKAFRPDGKSGATLIPPAFGLAGFNLHTWTGWGSIPYWNAFVAVLEMHGVGNFFDPRLDDAAQFPVAAKNKFGHVVVSSDDDRVSSKLPALQVYQLALAAPTPPAGSFDPSAAKRGDALFEGKAKCVTCHAEPIYTEPGWQMHTGAEIGIDDFQSSRAPDKRYRTSPLHGLFAHAKGGFYHDGRFATLMDVVDHYDQTMSLGLSAAEKADLVEYLKSL